jgi:hypothetical protein
MGVTRRSADVFLPWTTVAPAEEDTARSRHSAVATGAWIGAWVGLVAGIVIWANKKCEGFACVAKPVALPFLMIDFSVVGAVVGAGIGFVVGSTAGDYRQLPPAPSMPQLRVGVSLGL